MNSFQTYNYAVISYLGRLMDRGEPRFTVNHWSWHFSLAISNDPLHRTRTASPVSTKLGKCRLPLLLQVTRAFCRLGDHCGTLSGTAMHVPSKCWEPHLAAGLVYFYLKLQLGT